MLFSPLKAAYVGLGCLQLLMQICGESWRNNSFLCGKLIFPRRYVSILFCLVSCFIILSPVGYGSSTSLDDRKSYLFSSFCELISLTSSSAPDTNMSGRFNHGPASSLRSDASEALDDFRDDARLEQAVPRRLTDKWRKFNA